MKKSSKTFAIIVGVFLLLRGSECLPVSEVRSRFLDALESESGSLCERNLDNFGGHLRTKRQAGGGGGGSDCGVPLGIFSLLIFMVYAAEFFTEAVPELLMPSE